MWSKYKIFKGLGPYTISMFWHWVRLALDKISMIQQMKSEARVIVLNFKTI